MTSRLDRLFVLLETGSSAVTRKAAARQLGEVQRLHPHELHHLLSRITAYLRSPAWETRIAAGQAVEAVIKNVPQWDPPGCSIKKDPDYQTVCPSQTGRLNFQRFDMNKVLANSKYLMGSEGKEYDIEEDMSGIDGKEKMARQRQLLNARLGLDTAVKIGMNMAEIFTAEDLVQAPEMQHPPRYDDPAKRAVADIITYEMSKTGLSSREINRARRKARQAVLKQRSREASEDGTSATTSEEPDRKRSKQDDIKKEIKQEDTKGLLYLGENVPDSTGSWGDAVDWPFESFCDHLCQDLFSPSWEVRHGAATALREVIRIHGRGAGKSADISKEEMEQCHQLWLEDIALRFLCVLALDRFGDFVSDQVVAPVRETCAQALGSVLHLMVNEGVHGVLCVLLQLLNQEEWEARHGGLLGLKYLLAVREDLVKELLPVAFPHILEGLGDAVDDVGAVAAAALIPVATNILEELPDQVQLTVTRLWDLLLDQDELAAACNSFMGLLAALLSLPQVQVLLTPQPLSELVPRLWPFLCHSTSSVRRATLQTLHTLTTSVQVQTQGLKWTASLLQEALRHIFQRVLVESIPEIQELVEKVWANLVQNSDLEELLIAACPYMSTWLCLTMQPAKLAIDSTLLIHSKSTRDRSPEKQIKKLKTLPSLESACSNGDTPILKCEQKLYIGGSETIPIAIREKNVTRARCMASRMLGLLSCYIVKPAPGAVYITEIDSPIDCYVKILLVHLNSKSAMQRMVAGLVIIEWAQLDSSLQECPEALKIRLHQCLSECVYYDEIAVSFTRLLQETKDFIAMLKHYKLPLNSDIYGKLLTLEQIQQLSGPVAQQLLTGQKLKPKVAESLEERRKAIQGAVNQTSCDQTLLSISTQAALAGAVTMLKCLPEKLNPVIKPLMESIKKEENEQLQNLAADHLARLMELCANRTLCPNSKIVSNLCTFLRSDPEFTPRIQHNSGEGPSSDSGAESAGDGSRNGTPTSFVNNYSGILTLLNQQRSAERAAFRRSNSSTGRGPGRPPVSDIPLEELFATEDNVQKQNRIQRRGASFALTAISAYFGNTLPQKLPKLWEVMVGHLRNTINPASFDPSSMSSECAAEELVSSLQVLEVTSPAVHKDLLPQVLEDCLPRLCLLLTHPYRAVRHMGARCLGTSACLSSVPVMTHVVDKVLPFLGATDSEIQRQGAVEALACITEKLQFEIVPYIVLLVVPLLGRMSDQNQPVRLMATHCFATLIQLMPLDGGVPDPPNLTPELVCQKACERKFLEQLFNPKMIDDYKVPVPIQAQLRSYQQAGVNWLAFLNKYKLHGILCDDMGLGKTLQSICILAGDHYYRQLQFEKTRSPDCLPLPSLVICPPTLTGHWVYEVMKFLSKEHLNPLQYIGPPAEREKLRNKVKYHNLVVASYDIVRKDIDFFSSIKWNYCVLDEGHVIKNGKTKSSKAIKQLVANHRLILSGTPIQNNVLELWSLFDFLMPGFLGTEKQFTARYSKPILASRDPKSSPKEQEAGALAMEALHRQVLPFLLRRMKEDVLQDLPPKITQDYYCELSSLQEQLYEDFARSQAHQSLQESLAHGSTPNSIQGNTHIFQAIRYLQNVCNHPKLVLTSRHPEYERIVAHLKQENSSMADIQHAAKLPALKQLLQDCGIGVPPAGQPGEIVINQHRALIFCQLKAMLDILENDLFKNNMPSVTYLRLDGSILPAVRHSIVTRFNSDPSIDVLLLTTQVGGLGLNLTGADTVIFVEHDWNPTKDLQAMDRAHRIGQKKVVNVYRLITRGTLEEKIMGLQKFKLMTANTVISSENASMETMGTDQLLDLFSLDDQKDTLKATTNTAASSGTTLTMKTVLDNLPDLWEDKQYEEEYDLSNFINNLRR